MNKPITLAGSILILALGAMAFIRLAPVNTAAWDVPLTPRPQEISISSPDVVRSLPNGAYIDLTVAPDKSQALLAKLDGIALASPRTQRIAGSAETGRITWQTRSAFWGFPDYTTAESGATGVVVFARQRFGAADWGVNAARLSAWISRL